MCFVRSVNAQFVKTATAKSTHSICSCILQQIRRSVRLSVCLSVLFPYPPSLDAVCRPDFGHLQDHWYPEAKASIHVIRS